MSEKISRILYIKRFLEQHTDDDHHATVADILAYLAAAGIPASRQTVARDIEQLIESGADVVCNAGKPAEYFIGERPFEPLTYLCNLSPWCRCVYSGFMI